MKFHIAISKTEMNSSVEPVRFVPSADRIPKPTPVIPVVGSVELLFVRLVGPLLSRRIIVTRPANEKCLVETTSKIYRFDEIGVESNSNRHPFYHPIFHWAVSSDWRGPRRGP